MVTSLTGYFLTVASLWNAITGSCKQFCCSIGLYIATLSISSSLLVGATLTLAQAESLSEKMPRKLITCLTPEIERSSDECQKAKSDLKAMIKHGDTDLHYTILAEIGSKKSETARIELWPLVLQFNTDSASHSLKKFYMDPPISVPPNFLISVRDQFARVATAPDVNRLLDQFIEGGGRANGRARNLLSVLAGDDEVRTIASSLSRVSDQKRFRILFLTLCKANTLVSYNQAIRVLKDYSAYWNDHELEFFLRGFNLFKTDRIRSDVLRGVASSIRAVRLASYVGLQNLADSEDLALSQSLLNAESRRPKELDRLALRILRRSVARQKRKLQNFRHVDE